MTTIREDLYEKRENNKYFVILTTHQNLFRLLGLFWLYYIRTVISVYNFAVSEFNCQDKSFATFKLNS